MDMPHGYVIKDSARGVYFSHFAENTQTPIFYPNIVFSQLFTDIGNAGKILDKILIYIDPVLKLTIDLSIEQA